MGIRSLVDKEKVLIGNYGQKALPTITNSLEERDSLFLNEDVDDVSGCFLENDENSEEFDNNLDDRIERALFWESQESLLQEVLERYSETWSKLRQEVSRIVQAAKATNICNCLNPNSQSCTRCLRTRVVDLLCQREGLKATLCTSEWSNTKKLLGGKHEYIEVIASTSVKKKQIPFLIELEFRDQFTIDKACDKYRHLVWLLPEYYIGKADYLSAIVRVLCDAAKRSMKEKKLHMGPWRKRSFMQMKWSNSLNRRSVTDNIGKGVPTLFAPSERQGQVLPALLPSCNCRHLIMGNARVLLENLVCVPSHMRRMVTP